MDNEKIKKLQQLIDKSKNTVFFGGAGVSTESGIPDFRSADGIYAQKGRYSPEEIISHSFYQNHREEFFKFYKEKMLFPNASPNQAHKKLASMEKAGRLHGIITQNIDGLHQKAGSKEVIELHGSVHSNYCQKCHTRYTLDDILAGIGVPICSCGGNIKPDVVLYEEPLDYLVIQAAKRMLSKANLLLIGGTSLVVYPAANLIEYFEGEDIVLINKSQTGRDSSASLVIHEPIGEVFSRVTI